MSRLNTTTKASWGLIRGERRTQKDLTKIDLLLTILGKEVTDAAEIGNHFNIFFINIVNKTLEFYQ